MHRLSLLIALGACRIGFDEITPDGGPRGNREDWTVVCLPGMACNEVAPDGSQFTLTCAAGAGCTVDCTRAAYCTVNCGFGAKCDIACGADNCTVSQCFDPDCAVACAGARPTRNGSFATCP